MTTRHPDRVGAGPYRRRRPLSAVVADGGDESPQALWRSAAETIQLVFLVADATPHVLRQVPVPYTESMREAPGRGIKIFPVSSSSTDDQTEIVFHKLVGSPAPATCS